MPTADGRFDPIFDSQATFRLTLEAMARPGTTVRLPAGDPRCPEPACGPLAAVLLTLLDHEVTFAVVPAAGDGVLAHGLVRYLATATGSRAVPAEEADFVIALGALPPGLPASLRQGTPAFPDEGATLLMLVPSLVAAGDGALVELTGPGIPGRATTRLSGLTAADLAALALVNAEPPLGIDLLLIDDEGNLLCLPRSTRVHHQA